MTIHLSSGMRDAMIGSTGLGGALHGGYIQIYSGQMPESPDLPALGPMLGRITRGGLPPMNGGGLYLTFGAMPGELVDDGEWVLRGLAEGAPGWWRFVGPRDDGRTLSEDLPRIDGSTNQGVDGLPALIAPGATYPVNGFYISIPSH